MNPQSHSAQDHPVRERFLFASIALLLLAALGALILFVPVVTGVFAAAILLGLVLMFAFGFYLGFNIFDSKHPEIHSNAGERWNF